MPTPAAMLGDLEKLRDQYGPGLADRKRSLIAGLAGATLRSAAAVRRLHEALCFLRAYPDDRDVLEDVERQLLAFATRADVRALRDELADTGIAGTVTHYRFLPDMAAWIVQRWPAALTVDWAELEDPAAMDRVLQLFVAPAEHPALDEYAQAPRFWLRIMKGPRETDAAFFVRRMSALRVSGPVREALWASVRPMFRLAPGKTTPSRTLDRLRREVVTYQQAPLVRARPDLREEVRRPPAKIRRADAAEGAAILDVARAAMVARHRDLDVFSHGNPADVNVISLGEGLELACVGLLPERRLLLEGVFGFLTLKNGVPIGYVLTSALFQSSEVAYNVFDTWRGGESARIYGRVLAVAARLFRSDAFAVDPYQLGHLNDEGLDSGAWWFYQKLGFRPKDPAVLAIMERELAAMKRDPRHRSDRATLKRLVAAPMFFHAGAVRPDVLGNLSVADVGVQAMRFLAQHFGSDREAGVRGCVREASRRLGLGAALPADWTPAEREAFARWSPIVMLLPGLERWSAAERAGLVTVVRAKGGASEFNFVRRFDAHRKLRAAIVELQRRRLSDEA